MPKSMQEDDANILKNKLGVNYVRCSHYPMSKHFLNRCDELGLLLLEEIPGWQFVSKDEEWRKHHLENVKDMILTDRNRIRRRETCRNKLHYIFFFNYHF